MPIWKTFWGFRVNSCDTTEISLCGRFQFCTLQTVPKLAAESRLLVEANAIHSSLKTACLDENNVVAGSLGYYTQLCRNDVSLMIY